MQRVASHMCVCVRMYVGFSVFCKVPFWVYLKGLQGEPGGIRRAHIQGFEDKPEWLCINTRLRLLAQGDSPTKKGFQRFRGLEKLACQVAFTPIPNCSDHKL